MNLGGWLVPALVIAVTAVSLFVAYRRLCSSDALSAWLPGPSEEHENTIFQATVQIVAVVLIGGLWFLVFTRKPPKIVKWLSIVPAAAFALTLKDTYNPAVFGMALAAIFVAAEHYGGLKEADDKLEKAESILAQQKLLMARLLELNSGGLTRFKSDVYQAYEGAHGRIDAVVREFDIDEEWWQQDSKDPWPAYFASPGRTLFRALTETADHRRRTDKVQFVGEMPWPTYFFEATETREQRIVRFQNLLGLVWRLVVVEQVREHRHDAAVGAGRGSEDSFPYVRVVLAHCPSWMHAVDDIVFQVVERKQRSDSQVRILSKEQENIGRRLPQWAHEDIRRHARRGHDAETYVHALFQYTAMREKISTDSLLFRHALQPVLDRLGMKDWLSQNFPEDEAEKRQFCVSTFERFFSFSIRRPSRRPVRSSSELLVRDFMVV